MKLNIIQNYFEGNLTKFKHNKLIDKYLSEEAKEILYKIGLPNHNTFGGDYEFFGIVELIDNKYLKIGTRNTFIDNSFGLCIDINSQEIIGRTYYDKSEVYIINKNLKTYLEYIYTYIRFNSETIIPKLLGEYYSNCQLYAEELRKRLIEVDKDDVNTQFWHSSIEEMSIGGF